MSKQNLFRNYTHLITAIDYCITENLVMPALVLIYTAIDSVSWLASGDASLSVSERFQMWANNWMLEKYSLTCTAEELYAARCGVLHTLTPNSYLSEKKGIRRIAYAWGKGTRDELEESIKLLDNNELVAVHIDDLFWSFRFGFADFIEATMEDAQRAKLFIQKANKHFANLDIPTMNEFLESAREGGA